MTARIFIRLLRNQKTDYGTDRQKRGNLRQPVNTPIPELMLTKRKIRDEKEREIK